MSREACADFWRWCATVPVIGFTFAVAGLSGCGVIGRPQAVTTSNSDTLFSSVAGEDYGYEIVAAKSDDSAGEWTFALKPQRPPKDNNLRFEWDIDGQAYQGLAVSHIFSETRTYVISVRAIEPNGNDVFVLTLEIQIELPPPPNQAPVAVALAVSKDGRVVVRDGGEGEQVLAVYENEQVFLDGSESYDPDGDDTSFEWAQVTGNAIHLVQLVDASAAVASFVAPTVDGDARLAFTLTVSDEQRNTEVIVPVDVLNIVEIVGAGPEANAGEPQEVTEGDLVTLDGSNSAGSGTGELRFHWDQTCGPLVALANASQAMAAFNAPIIELESETLCFELTVSQDDLAASDEVRITILPAEPPGGEPPPDTPPCDDEDGDVICRDVDNCPSHSNSDQADDDLDGLGNVCDGCPNDPANDVDDDGHCGDVDNCPLAGNASQADSDGDGIGDACDDSDGDGVLDTEDNCPAVANANQADSDGDGVGDVCESEPSECKTGSSDWQNALFEQEQTGTFDVEFYVTPGAAPVDAIVALSSGEGSDFSHYAVLVRFNSAGTIDARNGGSYASDNTIRYTAGREYRLRLVVNVPLNIYSVFVTPPESDEIRIAADYAFRSEQNEVGNLDNWGVWADPGSHQVCQFTLGAGSNDPPLAFSDAYALQPGATLNAGAPGVLANDSDPEADPLTAVLVDNVSKGSLTLNPDGGFVYTPTSGYVGADAFTYKAYDGEQYSDPATVTLTVSEPGMASSVSQYGITWTFDGAHQVGQYVTGDWWVVGSVTITSVSPQPVRSGPSDTNGRNGSMVNPRFADAQGYDGRTSGPSRSYDPALCVLPPLTLHPGDTIVSCESLTEEEHGHNETWVKSAAVLTVVDVPQDAGRFRPPFCRPTRVSRSSNDPYLFSIDQIQWNLLPRLSRASISAIPPLSSSLRKINRPWIDHFAYPASVYTMPRDNMPFYGQWMNDALSEVALQLLLDYTDEELRPLLFEMVQIGIDYYGTYSDGGRWLADQGNMNGRKWPIVCAATMLDHPGMKNVDLAMPGGKYRFSEDGQTYYYDDPNLPEWLDNEGHVVAEGTPGALRCRGQKGWVGAMTGGEGDVVMWRSFDNPPHYTYFVEHEHLHVDDWSADDTIQLKSEAYRRGNTSMSFVGIALAARIMNAMGAWNHNAFFDYVDRWMTQDDSAAYDAMIARYGDLGWFPHQGGAAPFVREMWDAYRGTDGPFRQ